MALAATQGMGTHILSQHRTFQTGPRFCRQGYKKREDCSQTPVVLQDDYLVAYAHITLAYVVLVPQICALVPIHQREPMETLNCVCGHAARRSDIVLGMLRHCMEQVPEPLSLSPASEPILDHIWLATFLLWERLNATAARLFL